MNQKIILRKKPLAIKLTYHLLFKDAADKNIREKKNSLGFCKFEKANDFESTDFI